MAKAAGLGHILPQDSHHELELHLTPYHTSPWPPHLFHAAALLSKLAKEGLCLVKLHKCYSLSVFLELQFCTACTANQCDGKQCNCACGHCTSIQHNLQHASMLVKHFAQWMSKVHNDWGFLNMHT